MGDFIKKLIGFTLLALILLISLMMIGKRELTKLDSPVEQAVVEKSDLTEFKTRFDEQYPAPVEKHDISDARELRERLEILKGMVRRHEGATYKEQKELQLFYLQIIEKENEPWPSRVQALRNLKMMNNLGTQKEREQILSRIDKRILHLAQYTEEELLEQVIENESNQ